MKIIEVKEYLPEYLKAVQKLLQQLITDSMPFTEANFKSILNAENSYMFFLLEGDVITGMASVGIYRSPSGVKAWIEDVVVDEAYRGKGLGRLLIQYVINFAKSKGADLLMLTSSPKRITANNLYQSIGFKRKETNLYRMEKETSP